MVSIKKIGNRSWVFTFDSDPQWNLNVHLILGGQRNYVIDTGLGSLSMEPVMPYLQAGKPVVVVNTHYHWDHVWGNATFVGSLIIAHSLCYKRLDEQWEQMFRRYRTYALGEAVRCLPNLVFDNALVFPDDGIRLFYTPGHTEDGVSVLDEWDNVLNVGDNVGDDMEHILPELECREDVYAATLRQYIDIGADTCVCGHNVVTKADIFERILKKL